MQAIKGIMNQDENIYNKKIGHAVSSSHYVKVENQCGPVFLGAQFNEALKKLSSKDLVDVKNSQENVSNEEFGTIKKIPNTSKNPVQGFRSLKGNITICNSRVQSVIINNSNIVSKNVNHEKAKECQDVRNGSQSIACNSHSPVVSKINSSITTSASTRLATKVVMSTVPKRVPLVSTVGNFSKAPPFAAAVLSSSAANHSPPGVAVSNVQTNDTAKTLRSILESRLTSAAVNGYPVPNGIEKGQANSVSELCAAPNSGIAQGEISSKNVESKSICGVKNQEKNLVLLGKQKTSRKPESAPQAVLSYEKGLTRLVPVKAKSVVLVDVGVQVVIPNLDIMANEIMDKDNISATPLPAASSGTPSITQGTSLPSVSSTSPLKPGQFVAINPKTGKMVVAIPKHLLNSSGGSKTVLINGKPVKVQIKGSFGSPASSCQSSPVAESSSAVMSNSSLNVLHSYDAKESNHMGTSLNQKDIVPVDASLCTSVVTFSDTTAPSSHSSSTSTVSTSEFSASAVSCSNSLNPSPNMFPAISCTSSNVSVSDLITSPDISSLSSSSDSVSVNSVSKIQKFPQNSSFTSLSTETITTASFQSPFSVMSPSQDPLNNTNALVLPLTSPLHSPSKNALVQTIPNTTSLFILIPNSPMKSHQVCATGRTEQEMMSSQEEIEAIDVLSSESRKRKIILVNDMPPSKLIRQDLVGKSITNEKIDDGRKTYLSRDHSAVADNLLQVVSDSKYKNQEERCNNSEKKVQTIHLEGPCNELLPMDEGLAASTSKCWNTMDTIMDLQSSSTRQSAPLEISNLIRNAFNDYKNCLTPNSDGDMPIHVAVEEGNEVAVKQQCIVLAARKTSVNLINREDETPLQIALLHGYSSIAQLLLSRGADARVVDREENSTLHLAVLHADHIALQALLQSQQFNRTDVDCYNDEGFTPLHLAAQLNKVKEVNLLVKFGCEIDKTDAKSGRTALYHAIERMNHKAQQALIRLGADMREPTFFGHTPFFAAKSDKKHKLNIAQHIVESEIESDLPVGKRKRKKRKKGDINSLV